MNSQILRMNKQSQSSSERTLKSGASKAVNFKTWMALGINQIEIGPSLPSNGIPQPARKYRLTMPNVWTYVGTINSTDFLEGEINWIDGSRFKGVFSAGRTFRKGQFQQPLVVGGRQVLIVFEDDCCYQNGVLIRGTRRVYEWQQAMKKRGLLLSSYSGQFRNGMAAGIGVYSTPEMLYEGEFESNQYNGAGKLSIFNLPKKHDALVLQGIFRNGKLVNGFHTVLQYFEAAGGFDEEQNAVVSNYHVESVPKETQQTEETRDIYPPLIIPAPVNATLQHDRSQRAIRGVTDIVIAPQRTGIIAPLSETESTQIPGIRRLEAGEN